jgi:hypothetical protein
VISVSPFWRSLQQNSVHCRVLFTTNKASTITSVVLFWRPLQRGVFLSNVQAPIQSIHFNLNCFKGCAETMEVYIGQATNLRWKTILQWYNDDLFRRWNVQQQSWTLRSQNSIDCRKLKRAQLNLTPAPTLPHRPYGVLGWGARPTLPLATRFPHPLEDLSFSAI